MWGTWFNVTLSVVGVLLLLVIAIATAWTPLFAIVIAAAVIALAIPIMSARRASSERGSGVDGGADGAPASGEGGDLTSSDGASAAQGPREGSSSRISDGIWGERREA
jgi:hypothetical protein